MITITITDLGKPIDVPRKVATCPICDAKIVVDEVHEWECESGKPVGISVDCVTRPDIDSEEWPDWFNHHWRNMPYVYWLPVEQRVLQWFQKHYRCDVTSKG